MMKMYPTAQYPLTIILSKKEIFQYAVGKANFAGPCSSDLKTTGCVYMHV